MKADCKVTTVLSNVTKSFVHLSEGLPREHTKIHYINSIKDMKIHEYSTIVSLLTNQVLGNRPELIENDVIHTV